MPRVQDPSFAGRLGDAIVARRQWLAISQVDLAERLGVSGTQMGRYESGRDQVSVLMLTRLCTALGTTPHDLLGWNGSPAGASAHLQEMSAILADPDIAGVVRAMQRLDPIERSSARRIVETFCERNSL